MVSVNIPDALSVAATLAPWSSVRSVMTCHGIQADLFGDLAGLRRHIAAVVFTNQLGCERAPQLAGIEDKYVFCVPYGTRSHDLRRTEYASPPTFGYVGRLEQEQERLHQVIAVIRELVNRHVQCDWILAGCGPLESVVRYEFHGEISSSHMTVTGHVSDPALEGSVHNRIDALQITSPWETELFVAWAALSRGMNVVSSRYIGSELERALQHAKDSLFFDIGDTETAVVHWETLATQFPLVEELRHHAHVLVQSRSSFGASIQRWDERLLAISSLPLRHQQTGEKNDFLKSNTVGRLNRIFDDHFAESIRHLLKRSLLEDCLAGEWPHSLGFPAADNAELLALAEALVCREIIDVSPTVRSQWKHRA